MGQVPVRVGVDLGALYAKGVRLDEAGNVLARCYRRHRGLLEAAFDDALEAVGFAPGDLLGVTGSGAGRIASALGIQGVDLVRAQLAGVAARGERPREILDIGGGSCTLIQLDASGALPGAHASNSLCAAGTGSFLDEQADRLGITHDDAAAVRPRRRPAVHRRPLQRLRQERPHPPAAGGLLQAGHVVRALPGHDAHAPRHPALRPAPGGPHGRHRRRGAEPRRAALAARERLGDLIAVVPEPAPGGGPRRGAAGRPRRRRLPPGGPGGAAGESCAVYPWPLTLERSSYPSFACAEAFVDEHADRGAPAGAAGRAGGAGLPRHRHRLDQHQGGGGRRGPGGGRRRLPQDRRRSGRGHPAAARRPAHRPPRACGVHLGRSAAPAPPAAAGRSWARSSAPTRSSTRSRPTWPGAVHVDPAVDTIFEIGGQDSKYMHVVDGHIRDANMNYVCAAGTGSFVEEQARKLGYLGGRGRAGGARAGAAARLGPLHRLHGAGRRGAAPGRRQPRARRWPRVMVAVVKNYLNKVVGNRHRSRSRIFFQGATARNPALVAAFERLLGVEMVVSPYCHVMGAYGVALLARRRMEERGQRGLHASAASTSTQRRIDHPQGDLRALPERLHHHLRRRSRGSSRRRRGATCAVATPSERRRRVEPARALPAPARAALARGGRGLRCAEHGAGRRHPPGARRSHLRADVAALLRRARASGCSSRPRPAEEIRELGSRLAGADFCFPAKVALGPRGLAGARASGVDFVFVPQLGQRAAAAGGDRLHLLPLRAGLAGLLRAAPWC